MLLLLGVFLGICPVEVASTSIRLGVLPLLAFFPLVLLVLTLGEVGVIVVKVVLVLETPVEKVVLRVSFPTSLRTLSSLGAWGGF